MYVEGSSCASEYRNRASWRHWSGFDLRLSGHGPPRTLLPGGLNVAKRHVRRASASAGKVSGGSRQGRGTEGVRGRNVLPPDSGLTSLIQPPAANHLSQFNYLR